MNPLSYLKPSESLSEIVAGLIMVLTFTLAASVVSGGGADGARAALVGAIGCNTAWGIIDGVFYVMNGAFDRNRRVRLARVIALSDEVDGLASIRGELDPYLASVTPAEDRETLYRAIRNALVGGRLPERTRLLRDDMIGAVVIFGLALGAALPAVLPLAFMDPSWLALRVSNLLVVVLLFIVGYHWARYVDVSPWRAGLGLTGLGLALVGVAILLGG